MTEYPKYHIPKGIYDKTDYQDQNMSDVRTQNMQFMGDYARQNHGKDNIHPIMIPFSRQLFKPNNADAITTHPITNNVSPTFEDHTKQKIYQLTDPYIPGHGSNVNLYSDNPVHPFNQLNMIQDDVSNMYRQLHQNPEVQDRLRRLEITANPNLMATDIVGDDRGMIPKKMNEYDKPNFRDNNFISADEYVAEYNIHISSSDRDCVAYPDPYNYRVEFNPVSGTKQAYISRVFENVKYIDLRAVILPRKYYVITKKVTLYLNGGSESNFVNAFKTATINMPVFMHEYYIGSFTYDAITYYFPYYKQTISGFDYYFSNNDIFLDNNLTQKTTIQIGPYTNDILIEQYVKSALGTTGPPDTTLYTPNPETFQYSKSWILIDHNTTDMKIKFSYQDEIYENIIDKVYSFTYDSANNIVANSFKEYSLSKGSLEDERFLLLNIPEIESRYEYATDQNIDSAFCILYPDYINGDYYYLNTSYHEKLYDRGILGVINKMTIKYKHGNGTKIQTSNTNIIDYDITTNKTECICKYDPVTGERIRDYQCMHSYLRHPTFEKLQNTLLFKIGTIEGRHNNKNIQNK